MSTLIRPILVFLAVLSLTFAVATEPASAQNLNNFVITDFDIDYYLDRDAEGRSTLKTVETIDALFPNFDQNHGIERAIPQSYDKHPTNLQIVSVTDKSGDGWNYTTYDSSGNTVVRIGDGDKYVRGPQRFVITYMQRDVTRYFADTKSDEFYWDTNGTQWAVPINALDIYLHIDKKLLSNLTGKQQCYQGAEGSDKKCDIIKADDGYTVLISNLLPYENATIAVGFKPNTFSPYKQSLAERVAEIWGIVNTVTPFVAFILIVWFIVRYQRKSNRKAEINTIIPEYVPPKDTSLTAAANIYRSAHSVFPAQLIDFAVRHYMKIYQTREKSLFRKAEYELEITKDISDLKDEEKEIIDDIFPSTAVGTRLALSDLKRDRSLIATRLSDNSTKLYNAIKGKYGLRAKDEVQSSWYKRAAFYTLILAILTLSPWLLGAAGAALLCSFILKPLTDKGLALYKYLEGLKMYVKVAETERIKMLQGPDTAEKVGESVDPKNPKQMVKLYERVLPYAMIFGMEKAWNDRLGQYYTDLKESPDWYHGTSPTFNAAALGTAMHSFSSAVTYSSPSNSSSGGSSGGGSSGGGGGGGGGGGW